VTFAFCLRRDRLRGCRRDHPGLPAAAAACEYVQRHVAGVRAALDGAEPEGSWLAVGPVAPVIRSPWRGNGVFAVGNAAGEAHPIMGEGISMALQSACLLCGLLVARWPLAASDAADAVGRDYDRQWRRCFAPRIRFAALFAQAAMHTGSASVLRSLVRRWPGLLTRGARMGGKVRPFQQPSCDDIGCAAG
jgi:flavin-dependent dehydrogenase